MTKKEMKKLDEQILREMTSFVVYGSGGELIEERIDRLEGFVRAIISNLYGKDVIRIEKKRDKERSEILKKAESWRI